MENMVKYKCEYRCNKCKNLLFVGTLQKGTKIRIMCKKTIKKETHEDSKSNKNGKYQKCKTIKEIEV